MSLKWMVCGNARHGKDTVSLYLTVVYGLQYESSSLFVCRRFIFDRLAPLYGYATVEECYADRGNHRKEWFDLIVEYNGEHLDRVSREIFEEHDIYCGLRNIDELNASKANKTHDFEIWVDASKRKSLEPATSLTITADDCSHYVDNNGTLIELFENVDTLMQTVGTHPVPFSGLNVHAIETHLPDPLERAYFTRALLEYLELA